MIKMHQNQNQIFKHNILKPVTYILLGIIILAGCIQIVNSYSSKSAALTAVGDILLDRGVERTIERNGFDSIFSDTKNILRQSDITFGNLECPLSKRGSPSNQKYTFRAHPKYASMLKQAGFDVLSIANNHSMDYGNKALSDTIDALKDADILPIGYSKNRMTAVKPQIINKNGIKIGFLAYNDVPFYDVDKMPNGLTINNVNMNTIANDIKAAGKLCDIQIISFHWGIEYMKYPTNRQRQLARLCIDSGADLILGHHPHVLQPTEIYKGKTIIYSMGGFLWDSNVLGADKSAIYQFDINKTSCRLVKTIPIKVVNGKPSILEE